jgi:hypothetical protein
MEPPVQVCTRASSSCPGAISLLISVFLVSFGPIVFGREPPVQSQYSGVLQRNLHCFNTGNTTIEGCCNAQYKDSDYVTIVVTSNIYDAFHYSQSSLPMQDLRGLPKIPAIALRLAINANE